MAKDFSAKLKRAQMSVRERFVMFLRCITEEERTGQKILNDAERYELFEGYRPESEGELKKYVNYVTAYRTIVYAETDAQTTFLAATTAYWRALYLIEKIKTAHRLSEAVERVQSVIYDIIDLKGRKGEEWAESLVSAIDIIYSLIEVRKPLGERSFEVMEQLRDEIINEYSMLLGYKVLFDALSSSFGVDLNYNINRWMTELERYIQNYNDHLEALGEDVRGLVVDKGNIQPSLERAKYAINEIRRLLGDEFKT